MDNKKYSEVKIDSIIKTSDKIIINLKAIPISVARYIEVNLTYKGMPIEAPLDNEIPKAVTDKI